jgi:hypothetical protein
MKRAVYLWTGVALVLAAAVAYWLVFRPVATVRIAGVDGALPRADAGSEFILPEALAAAREEAVRAAARGFVVHRRGHRVFEYFASGRDGDVQVDGGELAAAVLALTLQEPDAPAESAAVAQLVSERLWLPLRAADAWLGDGDDTKPRRCCIRARLDDWMRVGDLLLGEGAYLGERFISADAVRQLLAAHTSAAAEGDEPFLARDGMTFDLEPGVRLWLAPRRNLAILVWGDAALARNTLLPNLILRGLNDPSPAIGGDISDIVPGH